MLNLVQNVADNFDHRGYQVQNESGEVGRSSPAVGAIHQICPEPGDRLCRGICRTCYVIGIWHVDKE